MRLRYTDTPSSLAVSGIHETDQDTKSTFSLLMELSRLELVGKAGSGPLFTIPLSGR